jgi:hypothetical protein
MIKLQIKDQALNDLKRFIHQYEEAFFELYNDSGVWNIELIIDSYTESAQKLYYSILEEIEQRLAPRKVLGRKTLSDSQELFFYVGDRLVIVYFSEDINHKIRSVESISIDRKPIIF